MASISFIKDVENKILIRKIVGEINANETIESFQTIVDILKEGFDAVGIVNDVLEGELNIHISEIPKIASFLKKNIDVFRDKKLAACVASPSSITIPMLMASQITKINIKAFSTLDAAYTWVLSYE